MKQSAKAKKLARHHKRLKSVPKLNLVSLMDIFTILVFFLIVNQVKIIPYAWMGQFSSENLLLSLIFVPIVPLGIWLGLRLHNVISPELFYKISYFMMIVAGAKLLYDGMI
jgi:uncharacterized membrane protein YfcA